MEQPLNELLLANMQPVIRQLDRLEERTRDIVTRSDFEGLRKELISRDALEPHLNALKDRIVRTDTDRANDKVILDKRIDKLEAEQVSKQDRVWIRFGQILAFAAFLIAMFDFLSHIRFAP